MAVTLSGRLSNPQLTLDPTLRTIARSATRETVQNEPRGVGDRSRVARARARVRRRRERSSSRLPSSASPVRRSMAVEDALEAVEDARGARRRRASPGASAASRRAPTPSSVFDGLRAAAPPDATTTAASRCRRSSSAVRHPKNSSTVGPGGPLPPSQTRNTRTRAFGAEVLEERCLDLRRLCETQIFRCKCSIVQTCSSSKY